MAKQMTNRIAEVRKAKGLTQAQLAEKLGVHWVTVSKLERGRMQLHTGWLDEIGKALGAEMHELIAAMPVTRETTISGFLEDGQYTDFESRFYNINMPIEVEDAEHNFWVAVEGKSLWPNFHDGDHLHFAPVEPKEGALYLGRFVIASPEMGNNHCGYIAAAGDSGEITLQILNGPTLYGVRPEVMAVLVEVRFTAPWNMHLSSDEKEKRGLAVSAMKG